QEKEKPKKVEDPADEHGAERAGEKDGEGEPHPGAGRFGYRLVGGDQFPDFIGRHAVEEVADEPEEIARAEAAEKVADDVADRRPPAGSRPEEEGTDHRDGIRRAQFSDSGDDRQDFERDENGGVE